MDPKNYSDTGTGLPILFSHGSVMDHTMFRYQIEALKDSYRVIAFDHRAATDRYADEYDLHDLVQDCIDFADSLGIDKFVLAGMSMGGFMGLELALKHQDRLGGLILIDTMAHPYTPEQQVEFGLAFDPLNTEGPLSEAFAEWCVPLVFGPDTIQEQPELVDHWLKKWADRPARSVWGEYNSWIRKADLLPRLGEITVPTLVVHGRDDVVLPFEKCGKALAEGIPGAKLSVIERAGHTSNEEQPEAVNAAIIEFLSGIERW
ncbi:alpha/beta hydrolase [Streptosporangium sp. NPDC049644]|uniref:alpha/beta fold hydrolase n=1 Tax=Streptosporangium sp. NPDC049644 TaxID=3155507 RepID=UPI00343656E2